MRKVTLLHSLGLLFLAAVLASPAAAFSMPATAAADSTTQGVFPLNGLQDIGKFALYLNEEPIVTIGSDWSAGGRFDEQIKVAIGGQSYLATLKIEVDEKGLWKAIAIESPRGNAAVTREGMRATIKSEGQTRTVDLPPGTVLFENMSPALMSQAVRA